MAAAFDDVLKQQDSRTKTRVFLVVARLQIRVLVARLHTELQCDAARSQAERVNLAALPATVKLGEGAEELRPSGSVTNGSSPPSFPAGCFEIEKPLEPGLELISFRDSLESYWAQFF